MYVYTHTRIGKTIAFYSALVVKIQSMENSDLLQLALMQLVDLLWPWLLHSCVCSSLQVVVTKQKFTYLYLAHIFNSIPEAYCLHGCELRESPKVSYPIVLICQKEPKQRASGNVLTRLSKQKRIFVKVTKITKPICI